MWKEGKWMGGASGSRWGRKLEGSGEGDEVDVVQSKEIEDSNIPKHTIEIVGNTIVKNNTIL